MGGVPTVGRVEGGKIAIFKIEHIWVEAYVDYFLSRGMKENAGDSWIPMDASFKQYDFTAVMNLKDQVPFYAEALANTIQSTFRQPPPLLASAFDQVRIFTNDRY